MATHTPISNAPKTCKNIDKRPLKPSVQVNYPGKLEFMNKRLQKDFIIKTFVPVLFVSFLLVSFLFYQFDLFK